MITVTIFKNSTTTDTNGMLSRLLCPGSIAQFKTIEFAQAFAAPYMFDEDYSVYFVDDVKGELN